MTDFGVPANDPVLSRPWSRYQPWPARIVGERSIGEGTSLLTVEVVPGVGEAPVAISSPPAETGPFELLVRDVGSVTSAVRELGEGGEIGIRGPYGTGFDVDALKETDLVFVAMDDGLASLRPMIERAVDDPGDFGDVTICYGVSSPDATIDEDRLGEWASASHVTVRTAVESAGDDDWDDAVGTVEDLVSGLTFDPRRTNALVAGDYGTVTPALEALSEKRLPDDHIHLTLEARMRCGVGVCGNCQFGELSVCRNGPVFDYGTVKPRIETV